jgi:hypothetical protein
MNKAKRMKNNYIQILLLKLGGGIEFLSRRKGVAD